MYQKVKTDFKFHMTFVEPLNRFCRILIVSILWFILIETCLGGLETMLKRVIEKGEHYYFLLL